MLFCLSLALLRSLRVAPILQKCLSCLITTAVQAGLVFSIGSALKAGANKQLRQRRCATCTDQSHRHALAELRAHLMGACDSSSCRFVSARRALPSSSLVLVSMAFSRAWSASSQATLNPNSFACGRRCIIQPRV